MNRALNIAGIVACALGAVLAAIITTLLTPLYWGAAIVPLAVLLAIVANVAFPILARELGLSPIGSALPYGLWLITVIVLASARPEGDVLLPAGKGGQVWVTYGMLAAGALAGGMTVAMQSMTRRPAPPSDGDVAGDGATASQPAATPERR